MHYFNYRQITINGHSLSGSEIIDYCHTRGGKNFRQIANFMHEWLSEKPNLKIQTSGSTGRAKTIIVEKNQMLQSAAMTAEFFNFKRGDTALLSLPANYIAGKMMIVRAFYSGLNLVCIEPSSSPLNNLPHEMKIDFVPLVPMQLKMNSFTDNIKKILLGGAPVHPKMERRLQLLSTDIFHSYGMTETLSHVAIRRINGKHKSEVYQAVPGVNFSVDNRNCLLIEVPFLEDTVITNDVVNLINNTEFVWKGRYDNVVNSGGIKFFPEEIEKKLSLYIKRQFFIAGISDEKFGEKLCLFLEGKKREEQEHEALASTMREVLGKYECPKDIFYLKEFKTTSSGKIKRKASIEMVR